MALKTKAPGASSPLMSYTEWKARVAAEMQRRTIPAGSLPEHDMRDLFIANATPEEATELAAVEARNARPPFGKKRSR
jgi:hypothetical protein